MKMPKGWLNWKNNVNLLPADMEVWITKGEKDFVAELMKEMAEELQREEDRINERPDLRSRFEIPVLKKFKGWK